MEEAQGYFGPFGFVVGLIILPRTRRLGKCWAGTYSNARFLSIFGTRNTSTLDPSGRKVGFRKQ